MWREAGQIAVIVSLLVIAGHQTARADVYKFTDEDGMVHYTNVKPAG